MFKGCVVDVEKLLQQIERSEKSRVHTEEKMLQLEKLLGKFNKLEMQFLLLIYFYLILAQTKESAKTSSDNANKLSEQLKECKSKLNETEESLKTEKVRINFLTDKTCNNF
jgi:hypothetical protein